MKVKKPNSIIYFIVYIIFFPLLKLLFRLNVDRSDYNSPDGPVIVVSNHESFMDFLVVMLSIYPRKVNAVTAQKFFLFKPLHKLLPLMGCIPKNLFDPDVRSIIGIRTVLKRGDSILLYPEGRCSSDGAYVGIHKSTGKLIKKLAVPVVSCYIEGSYRCMPFWRDSIRTGRVRISIRNLFTPDELQSLSVEDINSALDKRLSGQDALPKLPNEKPLRTNATRRLAEGLQNIIYWCPKCFREFTLETKGCLIRCTVCGNAAKIDRDMKFIPTPGSVVPDTIHEWFKDLTRYEAGKLHADMDSLTVKVNVRLPADIPGDGMIECGSGVVSLSPKGWYYNGELKGEHVSLFFPIDTVPALPIDPNDVFQIYAHGTFYMFSPEDKRTCIKYSVIGECAYWKFASPVQMTPTAIFNEKLYETDCI